jgi:hypothetical protein
MYPWPGWASYGPVPGETLWWVKAICVGGVLLNSYLWSRMVILPAIGHYWRALPPKAVPSDPAPTRAPTVPAYQARGKEVAVPAAADLAVPAAADWAVSAAAAWVDAAPDDNAARAYRLAWER